MRSKKISSMSSWMREGKLYVHHIQCRRRWITFSLLAFSILSLLFTYNFSLSRPTMLRFFSSNLIFVSSSLNIFSSNFFASFWNCYSCSLLKKKKQWRPKGDGNKLNFFLVLFPQWHPLGLINIIVIILTCLSAPPPPSPSSLMRKFVWKWNLNLNFLPFEGDEKMCTAWHSKLK